MEEQVTGLAEQDPLYEKAKALVSARETASIVYLQRKLGIGYRHASSLIRSLESEGVIAPADASGIRKALIGTPDEPCPQSGL